jgi:hypothetical protein
MSSLPSFPNFNLAAGLSWNPAAAAAAAAAAAEPAAPQQQQLPAAAAAAEGPYPSYLDADLLELYAEVKKTRKTVSALAPCVC